MGAATRINPAEKPVLNTTKVSMDALEAPTIQCYNRVPSRKPSLADAQSQL